MTGASGPILDTPAVPRDIGAVSAPGRWWLPLLFALLALPAGADPIEPLIDRALRHDNYKVRLKAATGLGRLRDRRATETLVIVLRDPHPLVRAAAVNALGKGGDASVLPALCKLRTDRDVLVQRTVGEALAGLGGPAGCAGRKVFVAFEVSGEDAALQAFVRQHLTDRAGRDPRVVLDAAEARAEVDAGRMPGVELKVRLTRQVDRGAGSTQVNCQLAQSIYDLKLKALRGSATQRAAIDLGTSNVTDQAVGAQVRECLAALAPVVYDGLSTYLDRIP